MKQAYKDLVELAAQVGITLLESHAESYRVEDTVRRILETSGLSKIDVISNSTGLYITLDDESNLIEPYTLVKRITRRGNHLNKIYKVNNISRALVRGDINVAEARKLLQETDDRVYSFLNRDLAVVMLVVGFAILFKANQCELLISILAGVSVALTRLWQDILKINDFMATTLATLQTTLVINLAIFLLPWPARNDILIISGLMPLFPGTAFTNGLRDTLKGDYISGLARITDALVIAVSIAIGVAIGLAVFTGMVQ